MARQASAPSLDGFRRAPELEAEINDLAVSTFGRGAGARFFDYMKMITGAALPPEATDGELRHYNGQRAFVAMIEKRVKLGSEARRKAK